MLDPSVQSSQVGSSTEETRQELGVSAGFLTWAPGFLGLNWGAPYMAFLALKYIYIYIWKI